MKLIVISSSKPVPEETTIVTSLFEHGLEIFHLRKPKMRTREMEDFIKAIPAHFRDRIVIHSHHKLARKYNLGGIHITRTHRKRKWSTWWNKRSLKLKNPSALITTSFHKLASLYENKEAYSYAFLGNIYDGISGNYGAGFNHHSLQSALQRSGIPIIARGGTNLENATTSQSLGFTGIALYGTIWKSSNPLLTFLAIKEKLAENPSTPV